MKKHISIIFALIILSCSSPKEVVKKQIYTEYNIVNMPLIIENDTVNVNELRFYKIQSALDAMKLIYNNYGKWDNKISSKHQENIKRIVWLNVKLLDDKDEAFTVIADGTETTTESFACLLIFDSEERDCFKEGHPYKEELTKSLTDKMSIIDKNSKVYRLFR